jgi:hypothetical protein
VVTFFGEDHYSRSFDCGWRPRHDDAEAIARRIHRMASALLEVDEKLGRLWPQFEPRAIRPTDPGPVLQLSTADLGRLIDRRGRFDPPPLPAACGPKGYSFVLVGNVLPRVRGQEVGFIVHAGSVDEGFENSVELMLDNGSEIWRDVGAGVKVLEALRDAWDADWVLSTGSVHEDATDRMWLRPWLKWVRDGQAVQAILLSRTEIPPNGETTTHGEGELVIWP